MAGVKIVGIAYKSTAPALTALMGGEVQLSFPTPNSAGPLLKSGKLRALAVTSAQPSVLFPDLPTVAASGLHGYELINPTGIFAPAKTPAAVIRQLNQEKDFELLQVGSWCERVLGRLPAPPIS